MGILENEKHFLHKHTTYIESVGVYGKDGGFLKFLIELGLSCNGTSWQEDHSTIDWNKTENHYQFPFSQKDTEDEIRSWLRKSELSKYLFLYTWLDWEEPIIKIKTSEFTENWMAFYTASVEGVILVTTDGTRFLEFTDDWKYHLNSNFEIKPQTKK